MFLFFFVIIIFISVCVSLQAAPCTLHRVLLNISDAKGSMLNHEPAWQTDRQTDRRKEGNVSLFLPANVHPAAA